MLLTIGSLLILAFSILFAAPYIVDFNDYRHVFEAQASKLMGRDVKVAGQVNLRFLPAPFVRFESVSIAGDDSVDRTPLIEADNFTIWLALPPLLRGTVEAREVEISQPRLNIQVHEDGGGNWEGIGNLSAELAYMPRDVALDAVRITGGEIIVRQNGQEPALGLTQVNGVLAANSLRGPYKFSGTFQSQNEAYEIRVSTSRQDDTNPMIIKSTMSTGKRGATYKFDGRVTDLAARPRLFGALSASLRLDQVIEFTPTAEPASKQAPPQTLEVGADIEILLNRVQLNNLRATFESQNRPQVIEGNIGADFFDGFKLSGQLSSKWMDFDQILGGSDSGRVSPQQVSRLFVRELGRFYNGVDGGDLRLSIGQASIGREFLSNLQFQLSKSTDTRDRVEVSAQLPGGNFASLQGDIDVGSDVPGFQGLMSVKGENLPLLTQWLFSETDDQNRVSSAFYTLGANVVLSQDKFSVSELRGEVSGSALTGSLDLEFKDVPQLTFSLDSDRVDLRNIVTGTPHVGQIIDLLKFVGSPKSPVAAADKTGKPEGSGTSSATQNSSSESSTGQNQALQAGGGQPGSVARLFRRFNGRVNVRIGQLALPESNIRDLRVKAEVDKERLQISTLDFRTDQGARLVMNGAFSELDRSPRGEIDLLMEGENGKAIAQVLNLLNFQQTEILGPQRLEALS
ncbi:MAG: AsmA family protein, partial [Methyloligellaceae bacterium]